MTNYVHDNQFPYAVLVEGAVPATPAAGLQRVYIDVADHLLKLVDTGGTVTAYAPIPLAQTYTPALQGATNNPVPTFTTQIGRYFTLGKLCFVEITIVSSTMTKTTLTDVVRVTLPLAAANIAGAVQQLSARLENGTAVKVASIAETTANAAYLQLRQLNPSAASALLTYAATDLGVLTNTVTLIVSGLYETV